MPNLDSAFIADDARAKSGVIDALSLGYDTLHVPELPASHQSFVTLRNFLDRADCHATHRIEIIVQSTDAYRIAEVQFNLKALWPDPGPLFGQVAVQAVIPLLMPLSIFGGNAVGRTKRRHRPRRADAAAMRRVLLPGRRDAAGADPAAGDGLGPRLP